MAPEAGDPAGLTLEALLEQCALLERRIRLGEAVVGDYGRLARLTRELVERSQEAPEPGGP